MQNPLSRPARIFCSLALIGVLSACSSELSEVRNGPQEVHPSPSELAKVPLYCGNPGQPACA